MKRRGRSPARDSGLCFAATLRRTACDSTAPPDTVPEMRAFLDDRAAQYPNLAEVFVYGESWERATQQPSGGHDLFGIKLTNKQRTGPKPVFFLMAAIHARELSTSELALRFVDHLLTGYGVDADTT